MKIIKKIIGALGHYSGLCRLCYILTSIFARKKILVVFTYHRITSSTDDKFYYSNYDKGIDKTSFIRQIGAITTYFNVVGLNEFERIITGQVNPRKHTALITFDDADSEFLTQAFPLLKKYNCPAVIFTTTDYIDTDKQFWHLRISNAIENMTADKWRKIQTIAETFPEPIKAIIRRAQINTISDKRHVCQQLVNTLNGYKQNEIDSAIDKLETITGKRYNLGIRCMGWDEQRELSKQGMRFESHAVSHRKLAELSTEEIAFELKVSKAELEKQLSTESISICYPAGSFDNRVIKLAPECGYRIGFTTQPGLCTYPVTGSELFKLPRMSIGGDTRIEICLYLGKIAIKKIIGGKID